MVCKHKNIKSVNCELFCIDCGEKLPAGYFTDPEIPAKTAAEPAPNVEPGEHPSRRKTRRKRAKKPEERRQRNEKGYLLIDRKNTESRRVSTERA